MNLEKANLKILVANNLGADIEDRVEGEQKAAYEMNGAADALRQAALKVPRDLAAQLDTALKEDQIPSGLEAIQVVEFAKKYLAKVGDFLRHLAEVEQQKAMMQLGRVDGLRQAMEVIQKTRDQEAQKVKAHEEEDSEDGGNGVRTSGGAARKERGSVADRRAAAQEAKPEPAVAQASSTTSEAAPEPTPKATPPTTEADMEAAGQAARKERGSVAERRAAEKPKKTTKKKTKKTAKTKPKLRAVKRAAPSDG